MLQIIYHEHYYRKLAYLLYVDYVFKIFLYDFWHYFLHALF